MSLPVDVCHMHCTLYKSLHLCGSCGCVHADHEHFNQNSFSTWKKMPLKTAFRPCDSYRPYQRSESVSSYGTTCDLSVPLTLLPLLRLMLLRADSLASRLWCPGCCCWWWSCSLWICSLMLLASWMAFITASWSPNSAVELRLDRMSKSGGQDCREGQVFVTLTGNTGKQSQEFVALIQQATQGVFINIKY